MGKNGLGIQELNVNAPGRNFCELKRLIGAVFSENVSSKSQMSTNMQFWIHNSIQMYHIGTALLGMKFHQSKKTGSKFLQFEIEWSQVMVTT